MGHEGKLTHNEEWDATDFGFTDASFETAVTNFGNDERYEWTSDEGTSRRSITRTARGYSRDEGLPTSSWLVENKQLSGGAMVAYQVDAINFATLNEHGQPLLPEELEELELVCFELFRRTQQQLSGQAKVAKPVGHTGRFQFFRINRKP
jgi:hypothetical protein